jgi:hypothetical protein
VLFRSIDECGGNTDLIQLLPDGRVHFYDHGGTMSFEQRTGMLEWYLARSISSLSNPEEAKSRLDSDIEKFVSHFKEVIQ